MDNYTPIKVVGKGTFGRALLVRSKKDGQQYIIKQIKMSQMSEREKQESLNEVRVLSSFNHPYVPQLEISVSLDKADNICVSL